MTDTMTHDTILTVRRDRLVKALINEGFVFTGTVYVKDTYNHDTIVMVQVDPKGRVHACTTHKPVHMFSGDGRSRHMGTIMDPARVIAEVIDMVHA